MQCNTCKSNDASERSDNYGIYTGKYCDKCYNDPEKYPFKKDDYFDAAYAGESLEPEE